MHDQSGCAVNEPGHHACNGFTPLDEVVRCRRLRWDAGLAENLERRHLVGLRSDIPRRIACDLGKGETFVALVHHPAQHFAEAHGSHVLCHQLAVNAPLSKCSALRDGRRRRQPEVDTNV